MSLRKHFEPLEKLKSNSFKLLKVYISTPDGLNIRFGLGQDNRLMVKISKPGLAESIRVVTFDSVLRIFEEQDFEILNYLTGEISGVKDGEQFKIEQNGER